MASKVCRIKALSTFAFLNASLIFYCLSHSARFFATPAIEDTKSTFEKSLATSYRQLSITKRRTYDGVCKSTILEQRDPSRIPAYIEGCSNSTYYGYVMRDLAARLLTATLQKSTVVVVVGAPNANQTLTEIRRYPNSPEEKLRKQYNYDVGDSFVIAAAKRGHQVIGVDGERHRVDEWWNTTMASKDHPASVPILISMFDPVIGKEDVLVENAAKFIQEASVKYIVFRVSSKSSTLNGVRACKILLDARYKLQVLSASHASRNKEHRFGPNTMIRDTSRVEAYLRFGAGLALDAEGVDGIFRSYLFATKGLDLAIPSRREYLDVATLENDEVLDPKQGLPFKKCSTKSQATSIYQFHEFELRCNSKLVTQEEIKNMDNKSLWYSGSDLHTSEAACVLCPASIHVERPEERSNVACATRFLPTEQPAAASSPSSRTNSSQTKPNIVVIMIRQLSQQQFRQQLPRTKKILPALDLTHFTKYTPVADLSEMNHAALFKGSNGTETNAPWLWDEVRRAGYATLTAENGCSADSTIFPSLRSNKTRESQWQKMFCFDSERPNCLGGSSSAKHMLLYGERFIRYHHQKKNPWAAFLSFVESQEDTGMLVGTLDLPIFGFLYSLRNKMTALDWEWTTIAVVSDHGLNYGPYVKSFAGLRETVRPVLYLKVANTTNDQSLKFNRNMYTTPYDVYKTLLPTTTSQKDRNDELFSGGSGSPGLSLLSQLPRNRLMCEETAEIPDSYCDLMRRKTLEKQMSLEMPAPPSILSFYADIPRAHKYQVQTTAGPPMPQRAEVTKGCRCATNVRSWFPCHKHPWDRSRVNSNEYSLLVDCPNRTTHFELMITPHAPLLNKTNQRLSKNPNTTFTNILFLEIDSVSLEYADRHFPKTRELLKKFQIHRTNTGYKCLSGFCSADFSSHVSLAGANSIPNQVAALAGCVTTKDDQLCGQEEAEIGAICKDPSELHYGLKLRRIRHAMAQLFWCPTRVGATGERTPWVFATSEELGYVNYFGEEFCFEGSPYVTQGNVFPSFYADIEPHKVFCRLAERRIQDENMTVIKNERWGVEKHEEPCIDGFECGVEKVRIALDHLEKMWDTYQNRPKLAFLNAVSAHIYTHNWAELYVLAERYDDHISAFLKSMLSREDAKSTVIILRSDHGLQRGPMAMDYSTQVEHTRPWTELLVPESLPGLSKAAFFQNQNRLTNGFDLYNTLRALMTEHSDGPVQMNNTAAIPDWSFNLLRTAIPANRTCRDARLDPAFCREESIRPGFGVCNSLDKGQIKFCRQKRK
jgi:hypothetical protein